MVAFNDTFLSVGASGAGLSYQWRFESSPGNFQNLVGATNATLVNPLLVKKDGVALGGNHPGVPSIAPGTSPGGFIPLNLFGRLELSDVQPFIHLLLDVKAITATAKAILHLPFGKSIALGGVILDFRGRPYVDTLL